MINEFTAIFVFLIIVSFYVNRYKRKQKLNNAAKVFIQSPYDHWEFLKRLEMIIRMKTEEFDICIIGGGSSAVGYTMYAAKYGLKVLMIKDSVFVSETILKNIKIIHCGIRYLAKAFRTLYINYLKIFTEALSERNTLMNILDLICFPLMIFFPVYQTYMIPYYWIGIKIYDYMFDTASLGSYTFTSKAKNIKRFLVVEKENLKERVYYFDSQFDDQD